MQRFIQLYFESRCEICVRLVGVGVTVSHVLAAFSHAYIGIPCYESSGVLALRFPGC